MCREAVQRLTGETRVTVFIDALDEGDVEDDVRDTVNFIKELTARNLSSNQTLHVCLASRHYPAISIHSVERLILETVQDHDEDIATYVLAQLRIRNVEMRTKLVSTICARASGVFLWVVLVVKILNKEADRGNQHKIPAKLQEIPTSLHTLFDTIIEKDAGDNICLLPTLMWVLSSKGSLQSIELYFAIMISTGQLSPEDMVWDPRLVDATIVENFLISSSRGLIEFAKRGYTTLDSSSQVQIIHESVREYLLTDELRKLDIDLEVHREAKCHWHLAKWCLDYIQLAVEHGLLSLSEQARSYRLCPFLEYATEYALSHAETAARLGHRQIVHDTAPVETWDFIGNYRDYSTMLYLLVLERRHHLTTLELEQVSKQPVNYRRAYFDARSLMTCTVLESAIKMRNVRMVHALLKSGADANVVCETHGSPLKVALRASGLIESMRSEREALGDHPVPSRDWFRIVGILLKNGADESRRILGRSFWVIARRYEWCEVFEVLVERGIYPENMEPDIVPQWIGAVKDKNWKRIRRILSMTPGHEF